MIALVGYSAWILGWVGLPGWVHGMGSWDGYLAWILGYSIVAASLFDWTNQLGYSAWLNGSEHQDALLTIHPLRIIDRHMVSFARVR